ncbi:MAG: hypothetical protein JWO60_3417 [Frankiales bacterium]|nr:hypothetical protein [Frankiales bacterium]
MSIDLITRLGRKLDEQRPNYDRLDMYYRGAQTALHFMAPEVRESLGNRLRPLVLNWPRLVVSAVEERLDIVGFRLSKDEPADDELWRIWQANGLDEASQQAALDALVYGCAYVVVWASVDKRTPRITVESARQMTVERSPMTGQITSALKRWHEAGYGHAVVYRADEITRWRTEQAVVEGSETYEIPTGGWRKVETLDNPLGQVPVAALVNRPRLLHPDGETELSDVIPLTDAVSKVLTDLLVTSEFSSAPRRWVTGMDISGGTSGDRAAAEVKQKWTDAPASKLWIAADPDTKFGTFPEATLDGFVSAVDTLTQQAAAVSGLPPAYFGIHGSEVASADAIRSSEATLVSKARRRQRAFGGAWEDVMRLAVLVRDGVQRPGMESLETIWRDPETSTVAQAADAAVKKLAVGVSREQVLEDLGYSPVQIQRMTPAAPVIPVQQIA